MHIPTPGGVTRRLSLLLPEVARHRRRRWSANGRAHIEVRGHDRVEDRRLREVLQRVLGRAHGVRWATWNPAIARVIVAFDGDAVDEDAIVGLIETVESELGVADEPFPIESRPHPGDGEPITRLVVEIGADVAALGMSVWGSLLRLTPLPVELASAVSFVESQTPMRAALARWVGEPAADLGFALTNAVAQGLAQGPLSLVNDVAYRADLLAEQLAMRGAWEGHEETLAATREAATAVAIERRDRPVPLPKAAADRVAQQVALGSLAGGVGLSVLGARRAAGAVFVAGVPKAAWTGRAAFAAELHRALVRRNAVVLDHRVLRRFEQIDFVVVDERSFLAADVEFAMALLARADLSSARVHGGTATLNAIVTAQRDGHVVAAMTNDAAALAHADCGVATQANAGGVAWHADVMVAERDLPLIVEAFVAARSAARRSLALAAGGSGVGALMAVAGPRRAARAATSAVNVASLAAIGLGTWDARRLVDVHPAARKLGAVVPWHALGMEDVLQQLRSSSKGLDAQEVAKRPVNRSGMRDDGLLELLRAEFATPLTPVLGGSAVVSALLGSVVDAVLVAGVLVGNAAIGVGQRLQTQRAVRRLETASDLPVIVRRDGLDIPVPAEWLVVGDVVVLSRGDVVPADCRVLESHAAILDESGLTGEAFPVEKVPGPDPLGTFVADRHSMLFADTTLVEGDVVAVVVAAGDDTEAARAAEVGDRTPPPSGVERRLAQIANLTVPIALGGAAVLSVNALLRGRPLRETVTTGVGLVAAAIPEGLPLIATSAQLGAARRLSERSAIVRAPRTIEALGRVDVLCFDKTGTLTEGQASVHSVAVRTGIESLGALSDAGRFLLLVAMRATSVDGNGNGRAAEGGNSVVYSHSTDQAVAGAVRAVDIDLPRWEVAAELPFEHDRAFHTVRVVEDAVTHLAVKGAPETVLPRCTTWRGDPSVPLDSLARAEAFAQVEQLAASGYRVLAVAQRVASSRRELNESDVSDLELVGFVALADAVRDTARHAVDALKRAGINIAMITGDHPSTAEAVARELRLLDGRGVVTGVELDVMADEALDTAVDRTAVYARVTPAHKARIVEAMQRRGRVVAMTGDGTNDAAAIRLADVGVALGGRATAAARHAADVVVTDDRLESIVAAIIEGRAMWGSVRDALSILLGGNLGELSYALAIGGVTGRSPLNARQTLLVNLLTDVLPAAAIASRPRAR